MTKDSQSQINSFARIYDYSDIVSGRVPFFGFRLCLVGKKLNGREARTNKLARRIEGGVIFAKVPLFTSKGVQWGPLISKVNTQENMHICMGRNYRTYVRSLPFLMNFCFLTCWIIPYPSILGFATKPLRLKTDLTAAGSADRPFSRAPLRG